MFKKIYFFQQANTYSGFTEAYQQTGICLTWHPMMTELEYFVCLGAAKNKGELRELLQCQRAFITPDRQQREQTITSSWKTNLSNWEITHIAQRRCILRKGLRDPKISR